MSDIDPDAGGPATLIGVGASAGGVEALTGLVRALPADLAGAVFVVLHVSPGATSVLAQILDRAGPLPAAPARDGERPAAGHVYVAPPDRHLEVIDGVIRVTAGPKQNGHRPAVDPLLCSLAAYGPRAVGIILSGTRDDGTVGLAAIAGAGGACFVQDPEEAAFDGMVRSALAHVDAETAPVSRIATRVGTLTAERRMPPATPTPQDPPEGKTSTRYTCPECGGHISREDQGDIIRFTCEIGHAYAPDSLDSEQGMALERALWAATRLLGDRGALLDEMAERAQAGGSAGLAETFSRRAAEAREAGATVRALLEDGRIPVSGGE